MEDPKVHYRQVMLFALILAKLRLKRAMNLNGENTILLRVC